MNKKNGRTTVLFVCMGNSCRSLMAEAIARRDASDTIQPFSAGLATIGFVAKITRQTLLRNGYWEEGLWSKSISPQVWEQADIVINMSGRTRELAFREYSKVRDWEIEDPSGQDPNICQQVFEKIRRLVAELAQECRGKNTPARITERRAHARLYPTSLILLKLSGANAGIVFNISEDGLALSAAMSLADSPLHNMRIQFPGSPDWIEAGGQIAWKSKSNKEAGVRFVGLTEEAQRRIRDWVSAQKSPNDIQAQASRIPEEQNGCLGIRNAPEPANVVCASSATSEDATKVEGPLPLPLPLPLPSSSIVALPLPSTGPRATAPGIAARDRRPLIKSALRFNSKLPGDRGYARAPRPSWRIFATLSLLVGLIFLTLAWVTTQRDVRSELIPVTQKPHVSADPVQNAATPPADMAPSGRSPAEDPHRQPRTAAYPSVRPISKASSQTAENISAQRKTRKQSSGMAASVNKRPLKKLPQPQGSDLPPAPPQLDAKLAQPADLLALPLNVARPSKPNGKETSIHPAKHPAAPANIPATVEIFTDPYPSLRVPDGRASKKQPREATLQLGHLLSRVEPVYPEEAKQQGIQGTVKLHAIIDRNGSVKRLQSPNDSPILVAAAMNAVLQWRYSETLLAGKSVETEGDIVVIFRLSNPSAPKQ
jgi:TonB family protein